MFRSQRWLGTLGHNAADAVRESAGAKFLLEAHGKSKCDGCFGLLSGRRRQPAATGNHIITLEDLAQVYRDAVMVEENPWTRQYIDVVLPTTANAELKATVFTRASLPCGPKGSYSWSFHVNDTRRQRLAGRGAEALTLTGIDCTPTGFQDFRLLVGRECGRGWGGELVGRMVDA